MRPRDTKQEEINKRVGELCVLLHFFPPTPATKDQKKSHSFEADLTRFAQSEASARRKMGSTNFDTSEALFDHALACEQGNFVERVRRLEDTVESVKDTPRFRDSSNRHAKKAETLHHLVNVLDLAEAAKEKDADNTPQQFINLLEALAKKLEGNEEEQFNILNEFSQYITERIEKKKKEKGESFNELDVYKECIKEINIRLSDQYSNELVNLQSALKSYGDYLRQIQSEAKSDNKDLAARIKKCDELIQFSANTEVDLITKISRLAQGLKDMDTPLEIKSADNKQIEVAKCSQHENAGIYRAFNNILDYIGKKFPSVLQHKKGFSKALLHADLAQDARQTFKPGN